MSTLREHIDVLVKRREHIRPDENHFLLWDDAQFKTNALLLCATHLDELQSLAKEQEPFAWWTPNKAACVRITEFREIADLWRANGWEVVDLFRSSPSISEPSCVNKEKV